VSPREYRLGRREASVEQTRERILRAARSLFSEAGFHAASLEQVAARADVARATVYHHYASKLGLLDALMYDAQERAGMNNLARIEDEQPTGAEALRAGIAEHCRCWAREQTLFRNLIGLAAVDPEARKVIERHDARWRTGIEHFVQRLAQAGALRPDYPPEQATAVIHLLLSFETFDRLHARNRLTVQAAADTLTDLAATVLTSGEQTLTP
jgi:AcrR family transcriptional regulator